MKLTKVEIRTIIVGLEQAIMTEEEFIRCNIVRFSNPLRYCSPESVKGSKAFIRRAKKLQKKLGIELKSPSRTVTRGFKPL